MKNPIPLTEDFYALPASRRKNTFYLVTPGANNEMLFCSWGLWGLLRVEVVSDKFGFFGVNALDAKGRLIEQNFYETREGLDALKQYAEEQGHSFYLRDGD
jgi:hypothetical protein